MTQQVTLGKAAEGFGDFYVPRFEVSASGRDLAGGVVRDVRESDSGYYVHIVDPVDGGAAVLDFAADERPTLESLREGDRVRYVGRVTGAEDGLVTLDSPTINRAE